MHTNDSLHPEPYRAVSKVALSAAGFGILVGFAYSVHTFLNRIFRTMPCERVPSYESAISLAPLAYLAAGILLLLGMRAEGRGTKIAGVGLGASATIIFAVAALINSAAQAACQERSLDQALSKCGANPNVYISQPMKSWATITLVAPGSTDQAFSCLSMWADTHPDYSLEVDKSVYDFARGSKD
jgi:hypothetical protein